MLLYILVVACYSVVCLIVYIATTRNYNNYHSNSRPGVVSLHYGSVQLDPNTHTDNVGNKKPLERHYSLSSSNRRSLDDS